MPLISVILPTFNRGYCLERAVGSVLAQTFQDWELILVDDGSTDSTRDLRRKFASGLGDRYRDATTQRLGASGARNLGIREARGEWIAFLDSDDVWMPQKLDLQIGALKHHRGSAFCYTDFFEFDDAFRIVCARHSIGPMLEGSIYPQLLEIRHNLITCPSVIVRRELVVQAGLFDKGMSVCEDIDLWARLAVRTAASVVRLPLTGVHCRHDQAFPYAASVRGREALYRRAAQRDPTLTSDFLLHLFEEALETFRSVAAIRQDRAERRLFDTARRQALAAGPKRLEVLGRIFTRLPDLLMVRPDT